MNSDHLDFYFDYLSPYAYFAWRQIVELCDSREVELRIHPVVFGKLLDHWGQLGPAEIPPKRKWLYRYCYRYASLNGFEYNPPKYHPFNPLPSLRLSLREVCGDSQRRVVAAIFDAGWSQGKDIGDLGELISILGSMGLDGNRLSERIRETAVKEILIKETREAIERGVFGVPTTIIGNQLFWGNDQLEHIALYMDGKDSLDEEKVTRILARQRTIVRKAVRH